jgi:hypothetical protein
MLICAKCEGEPWLDETLRPGGNPTNSERALIYDVIVIAEHELRVMGLGTLAWPIPHNLPPIDGGNENEDRKRDTQRYRQNQFHSTLIMGLPAGRTSPISAALVQPTSFSCQSSLDASAAATDINSPPAVCGS